MTRDERSRATTGPIESRDDLGVPETATGWIAVAILLVTGVQHLVFPEVVAPVESATWSLVFEFDPAHPGQVWRWVTSIFAHSGIVHLGLNLWFLTTFGWQTERIADWKWTLGTFVVSALAGHIALLATHAAGIYGPAVLGASGGALGLFAFGAGAVPWAEARIHGTDVTVDAWVPFAVVLVGTLAVIAALGPGAFGIDHPGHLGGLVGGFAIGAVYRVRHASP